MYEQERGSDESLRKFQDRTRHLGGTRAGVCVCCHMYTGSTASFSENLYKCLYCGAGLSCGNKENCKCYRGEVADGKFLNPYGYVVGNRPRR